MNIELDWSLWCPRHLEPLRKDWPRGCAIAMVTLFKMASEDERVVAACNGDSNNLQGVLKIISPVCCYLPTGMAEDIVTLALHT